MQATTTEQAARIGYEIDRAQLAYGHSAAAAERILPFLSPERQVASGWRGGLLNVVY